jgi:hypothetical protein
VAVKGGSGGSDGGKIISGKSSRSQKSKPEIFLPEHVTSTTATPLKHSSSSAD